MNKAYIILAHKNAEQVIRLINRLDDDSSTFFIHFDKKFTGWQPDMFSGMGNKVHLIKRTKTFWGGYSLVEATLLSMRAIKAMNKNFDVITLLSGQDYPIKSNEHINHFFLNADRRIFMEYYPMPNYKKWPPGGGMYRFEKYFFGLKWYELFSSRATNFSSALISFLKRRHPEHLRPYAGSQWWTIDMHALNYILNFVSNNPDFSKYHKYTFVPDEVFFQTILLNASDERIIKSISNNNKRFLSWKIHSNSGPDILQSDNLNDIMNSDALFARKLDLSIDPHLFDLIDKNCLHQKINTAPENHMNTIAMQ